MLGKKQLGLLALCGLFALVHISSRGGPVGLEEVVFQVPDARMLAATQKKMDEGQIQVNPESDDPAADFYAQGEDAGDDEDIPDAGPGGMLPGWTQPELVDKPKPADLASFVSPSGNGPVFATVDYQRNPGAISAVNSARSSITSIKESVAAAQSAAEDAKAKYERDAQAAAVEEGKYRAYEEKVQKMKALMAARQRAAGRAGSHNWAPLSDSSRSAPGPGQGNLMWGSATKPTEGDKKGAGGLVKNGDGVVVAVDTDKSDDPAADFRAAMYKGKHTGSSGSLVSKLQKDKEKVLEDEAMMARPMQLRAVPRAAAAQRNVVVSRSASSAEQKARVLGLRSILERDEARELIAKERYSAAARKASPFHAAAWTEGCPEGTPGCATRSSLGYLEKPSSGVELEMPSMQRAGDKRVSAKEAMNEVPHLF